MESGGKFSGRHMLAVFVLSLIPLALFVMSIAYGYMSYHRFLNPKDLLYNEEYGLKTFNTEKTEAAEAQAEIKIDSEPRVSTREDWEEPNSQTNKRENVMTFWICS